MSDYNKPSPLLQFLIRIQKMGMIIRIRFGILGLILVLVAGVFCAAFGQDTLEDLGNLSRLPKSEKNDLAPDFMEHLFGPTNVNGAVGNGRLTAGISSRGTVTVLKWPRPSFHDQLRYMTFNRNLPRMGARENDGAFLGLWFDDEPRVAWLRDADKIEQVYADGPTMVLQTTFYFSRVGLIVRVFDSAPIDVDALVRRVVVTRTRPDGRLPVALVAFTNLSLCRIKIPMAPVADWLGDRWGKDRIQYDTENDLLIQRMVAGPDDGVSAAIGFFGPSIAHQCGRDGLGSGGGNEAFLDAADGALSGAFWAEGQVDAALATPLSFDDSQTASAGFFIAFGPGLSAVLDRSEQLRGQSPADLEDKAALAQREWLDRACMPRTDDPERVAVMQRALLLTTVIRDERSSALGCSVATQPPYALDWPRDGAFVNRMLDVAGFTDWVTAHNLFYAAAQRAPLGNWDMCLYGDGVVGGPLFLELDTIGFVAWTLWEHYHVLEGLAATEYLDEVYESIARAADFFVWWRDSDTWLPLPAFESDFPTLKSTLLSAIMADMTLRCAIEAGAEVGESEQRIDQWNNRRQELSDAIYANYFDPDQNLFLADPITLAYLIHPVEFLPVQDARMVRVADELWEWLEPIISGQTAGGSYLGLITIALARAWKDVPERQDDLEQALDFLVTELPTAGTRHYGECFVTLPDGFEVRTGIPHPMTAALTYLTAAEMYGVKCAEPDEPDPNDDDEPDPKEHSDPENGVPGTDSSACCGCSF